MVPDTLRPKGPPLTDRDRLVTPICGDVGNETVRVDRAISFGTVN